MDRRTCNSRLVWLALLATALVLASCLPVRVGDPEQSRVDARLNGIWLMEDEDNPGQFWFFRPWDSRSWLLIVSGNDVGPGEALVSKAWMTELGGKPFLVLEPAAAAPPASPKAGDYPFSNFRWMVLRPDRLDGDTIEMRPVDENFGGLENVATSADAGRIIAENADNPALYGDDPARPGSNNRLVLRRPPREIDTKLQRLLWKRMGYGP